MGIQPRKKNPNNLKEKLIKPKKEKKTPKTLSELSSTTIPPTDLKECF